MKSGCFSEGVGQKVRGQILLTSDGRVYTRRPPRCVLDVCGGLSPSLLCVHHRNDDKLRTMFPHT